MMIDPIAINIRAKIIGALIRDARLVKGKQIEECALAIGVSSETFERYELGSEPISLPELEGIAYFLDIPLEHFWGTSTLPPDMWRSKQLQMKQLIQLRNRMIGALLRLARLEAGFSLEDLADQTQIDASLLEAYELGQEPIPLPYLEVLSGRLKRSIKDFVDQYGPVGTWNAQQHAIHEFLALPPELQKFIIKPINRLYLEHAVRVSEMSADKLRAIAEGLLEITY